MSYLLDTHTFLFAIMRSERLSAEVREVIMDREQPRSVSAVSIWEIIIKVQAGKLDLPVDSVFYQSHLRKLQATVLPVDARHSFEMSRLPLLHKDPFDRLLIAQARAEDMILLTRDEIVRQYPVKTLW